MNEVTNNVQKTEKVASIVTRILAVIGFLSLLALFFWMLAYGIRAISHSSGSMGTAASYLSSFFSSKDESPLHFTDDLHTTRVDSSERVTLKWNTSDSVDNKIPLSTFSYQCTDGLTLSVKGPLGWKELVCEAPLLLENSELEIIPRSDTQRYNTLVARVSVGEQVATTSLTVFNKKIKDDARGSSDTSSAKKTTAGTETIRESSEYLTEDDVYTPHAEKDNGAYTQASQNTRYVSADIRNGEQLPTSTNYQQKGADLAVKIRETGILIPVEGKQKFFPVGTIPNEKTAAVIFEVINNGDKTSGPWGFIARLPVKGDEDYKYTSPVQPALQPGETVSFTLGFDEVTDADSGRITIALVPSDKTDDVRNNLAQHNIIIK